MTWLIQLFRIAFDPVASSMLAASLVGQPELGDELVAICRRESNCRMVGVHPGDQWAGRKMFSNATRVGWLDPRCPFHRGPPGRFSTRGVHGLSAAYSLRFLGSCVPPEALDVPLFSALAAALRAKSQCRRHGACSASARHKMWIGLGRVAKSERSVQSS